MFKACVGCLLVVVNGAVLGLPMNYVLVAGFVVWLTSLVLANIRELHRS